MSDDDNNNLPATQPKLLRPWEKGGPSPWPGGRGKGHLNKFSKSFLQSVSAKWREYGDAVLDEVRRDDPGLFLRVCASLIPKELLVVTHNTTPVAQMSTMELQAIVINDATTAEKMRSRLEPLITELAKKDLPLAKKMWTAMKVDDDEDQ
jgi:hypothetical protein